MRVFTYFVEPASYTLDLIENIHSNLHIDYAFIKFNSEAKSEKQLNNIVFLQKLNLLQKLKFIYKQWKKYDFIIINGYNNYVFICTYLLNMMSLKKRFIGIESDTQLHIPKNIFKRFVKYIYLNIIFQDKWVLGLSGGNYTHKKLFSYYGMDEERLFFLPMMVDNSKYYNYPKIYPETFTFMFVGRLIPTKNVDILCEVFIKSFLDKDAKLIIVGSNDNKESFIEKYMHKKIEFKGSVYGDDLIRLYRNSSVFVFPSTKEAWGLVLNEALASSLPVIAHKEVGSVHDLICNKETGFIIDDWVELESRMLELYNNQKLCNEMSINAHNIMKNYWNYSLYKSSLDKVFKYVSLD